MNSVNQQSSLKEQLIADFQTLVEKSVPEKTASLDQLRREAIRQFDRLGFPTIKQEEWKYTNLAALTKQSFDLHPVTPFSASDLAPHLIPGLDANIVVFVNGVYQADLSTISSPANEINVLNLTDAVREFPEVFEQHFSQVADYQNEPLTALNTAFAQQGVFLHVPANKVVEKPVVMYFLADSRQSNAAAQPRNLFIAGPNSQCKVVEVFGGVGDKASFTNSVTEIILEPNAHVEYYKLQNESDTAYHIGTTTISQQRDSHFYAATITLNGGLVRNNLRTVLQGEGCEANLFGLYMPDGKQLVDNHTTVDHAKPNCYSNELYKGILNGRSTGVFNGKIFVRPDAQKTNAFQSNRNIVLSNDASMNTKPQLEIYADDVKCSHGSTTGQMDEDALFYLRARGIGEDSAKALLMVAFASDVVNQVRIPALRDYLESRIAIKLTNK